MKQVSLRFFPRGNLRLLLTSPMGTTSTLLFERPRDVLSSNFDDWPFLSVHFWGEKADGRWTLQIINAGNRHVNSPGESSLHLPIDLAQIAHDFNKARPESSTTTERQRNAAIVPSGNNPELEGTLLNNFLEVISNAAVTCRFLQHDRVNQTIRATSNLPQCSRLKSSRDQLSSRAITRRPHADTIYRYPEEVAADLLRHGDEPDPLAQPAL